jgi:hypothetical protein
MIIVADYRGRGLKLLKDRMVKIHGSRYATRASVAKVLRGEASRVDGGSAHRNAVNGWCARSTNTRLKIGCHVFVGSDFELIKQWALKA